MKQKGILRAENFRLIKAQRKSRTQRAGSVHLFGCDRLILCCFGPIRLLRYDRKANSD